MILRLGLNAAVHTAGGMVLGMLAVGTALAACRYANCNRKHDRHTDTPPPPRTETPPPPDPGPPPAAAPV